MSLKVDVIIPVFRGESESRACIGSVLAARRERDCEIVVVDDASPERALSAWLESLANEGRITRIAHAANRGFVASVNEGMALHPDRDVVLLNSDTEVADGWIDRLCAHAGRDARVGTVTPFSNNATICSYPRPHANNPMPGTTAAIDLAFAAANAGESIELPTAVGFCMFIARRCIEQVGPFDEARYGAGYGEEVDFCMRAARAGFTHRLAGDVFVRHIGEISFGESGAPRRTKAQATIDALYPEFMPRVSDFVARDPPLALRRRADLERLRRSSLPILLFTSHDRRGGVRRYIDDLAALLAGSAEVLLLRPHRKSYVSLEWLRPGEAFEAWFHAQAEWDLLVETLRSVNVSRVHYHHVHGLPQAILDLPRRLGVPWDMTLHDYYPICPQYQLTDASHRYCGEPDENGCMRCLDGYPVQWSLSIEAWRAAFRPLVVSAQRLIAPSQDAADRIRRYFPEAKPVVWPHPERPPSVRKVLKVLVPGGISPAKGFGLLEACARDARERDLPLHFRVLGYIALPLAPWPELPLSITGEFPEGSLAELIALERGDAIFFPVQWPETYSYTLSSALESGLPLIASDLGALPERLAGRADARIFHWKEAPARVNDTILELLSTRPKIEPAAVDSHAIDGCLKRYCAAFASPSAHSMPPVPALQPANLTAPDEAVPQATLLGLYDDGVLCGNQASRTELRAKAQAADAALARAAADRVRLETAEAEIAQARDRLQEVDSRLAEARAGLETARAASRHAEERSLQLETSTSWRLTAPLRALARLLGRR